ncbi:hypothetical protein DESUT3_01900 [Desulfuromonas versatilis]|uniref:histidine kinase n=1 Tax=Desulfuromonas versatilis TaxID=2802975 RepID=A0ABM9SDA3_9BACT|nr:PAS domain S-box protein [Desulfuromonas versatilis]BCR03121.1 hypothetical protein DESUT3_01900 [Desulfuromonas versatilis]
MNELAAKLQRLWADISLKIKIALLASGLVLALTGIIASFLFHNFERQLQQNLYHQQFSLVSALAESIDEKLELAQAALVAAAPHFQHDGSDPEGVQEFLDDLYGLRELFDRGLCLFSPEGDLVAATPFAPDQRGKNFAFREYFRETVTSGLPVISEPYFSSREDRAPSIILTAPIHNKEGKLIAVMGGAMDLLGKSFLAQIATVKIGLSGYVYVYNTDRTIIVHPDPSRILQQDVPPGVNPLFDRALEGFEGTGETINSLGLRTLSSFKRLKKTNWIMAANFPVDEAYAFITQARTAVWQGLLMITLPILAATLGLIHLLLRRLQSLTRHVQRLPQKQGPEKQLPIGGKDEIGILAQAFNAFVNEQGRYQQTLVEAKEEAEKERARSEAVIAGIGDGLNIIDRDFKILYQNQVTRDLIGDRIGEDCYQAIHQRKEPCPGCAIAGTFRDGRIHIQEHITEIGGKTIWVEITASPIRDSDGKIVGGVEIVRDVTARKTAEERLRKSEHLLSETQRIAGIGSFDLDLKTFEQTWSEELYRIHQLPPGTPVTYETIFAFNPPEDRSRIDQAVREAIEETGEYEFEHTIIRPDGTTRIMQAIGRVIYDEAGAPLRLIGTCQDITERRQAEEQLRILSEAVKQSPVCIVITDPQARIQYVNPRVTELTGYRPEEVIGDTPSLVASGNTPREVYQQLWQTLGRKESWRGEFQNRKKNGELYWEQALIAPILDAAGKITHYIAIKEDVTERKQSEERIRMLSLAVEQSPALVMITDTGGLIQYLNPRYEQVTGYAAEELVGRNAAELGDQDPLDRENMWLALSAGEEWQGEFRNKKKSGEVFYEAAAISPVKNPAGTTTHFVKVAEDITESRALAQQLRHVQKMEAIGQLAGGIAHDFNNLLTAIIGYASIQQFKAAEGSSLKSDLAGIIAAANRGTRLTKDLLAFSRKRNPDLELPRPDALDLNDIIERGCELLKRLIGEDIELVVELSPEKLPVRADRHNLEQVLLNLGTNARDAMPQGGRLCLQSQKVHLDQQFVARHGYGIPGDYAQLSVSDSGCGMSRETVERIFEPFFTTKEVNKGTGLGLSIIYGIVKQHKGFITCGSQPGQGTTFRILLPLNRGSRLEQELSSLESPTWELEPVQEAEKDYRI